MPRLRDRVQLRIAPGDIVLLRAAAERLDMSVSELIRTAAIEAAIRALRGDPGASRAEVPAEE